MMPMLTKSEELLMVHIWDLGESFLKDILQQYDDPIPAATTIATFLKRMTNKGFVGYELVGKRRRYHALVSKEEYFKKLLHYYKEHFFADSMSQMSYALTEEGVFEREDLQVLRKIVDNALAYRD